MALYRGTYYYASRCIGSARPGAKALMSWYLGAYGDRGAANLGIYVCKRLGSGYSIHAEGRACDLGTKPYNNPGGNWPTWGWALANALRLNSHELGIQLIIFNRKVWSCKQPDAGWRDYNGFDPHDGHMHVELTDDAAANLTVDRIESALGGATPHMGGDDMSLIGLKRGDSGERVKGLQGTLRYAGFDPVAVDGDYGPKTSAAVLKMRKAQGSSASNGDEITGWAYAQLQRAIAKAHGGSGLTASQIAAEVTKYLKANPPKPGEDGKTPTKITLRLTGDVVAVE